MFKEKDALPDTWLDLTRPQFDALFDGDSDERVITNPSPEEADAFVAAGEAKAKARRKDMTAAVEHVRQRLRSGERLRR